MVQCYHIHCFHSNLLEEEVGGGAHGAVCGRQLQISPNLQVSIGCVYIAVRNSIPSRNLTLRDIVTTTGKGISQVISSVEGSLGIPSPTSMADEDEGKIVSKLADGTYHHCRG